MQSKYFIITSLNANGLYEGGILSSDLDELCVDGNGNLIKIKLSDDDCVRLSNIGFGVNNSFQYDPNLNKLIII